MVAIPVATHNQNTLSQASVLFCDASRGHSAAKTWRRKPDDGQPAVTGFSAGKFFTTQVYPVASIRDLGSLISWVIPQGNAFLTRYEPVPGLQSGGWYYRRARSRPDAPATFREHPGGLRWTTLDIDGLELPFDADLVRDPETVIRFVISKLPACFQGVTCFWTLTSSAGVSRNPRVVSLRLFYWIDRPLVDEDATTWIDSFDLKVDSSVFHPVQAIYVAAPRFEDGLADPVPRRCGFIEGSVEQVTVPPITVTTAPRGLSTGIVKGRDTAKAYEDYMQEIGDGPGLLGFYKTLLYGTWAYVASGRRDWPWLKQDIRARAAQAPRKDSRSEDDVEKYLADETLDDYIEGAIEKLAESREIIERERLEALAKSWKGKRSNESVAERGRLLSMVLSGLRIEAEQAKDVAAGLGRLYSNADPMSVAQHFTRSLPNDLTVDMIAREVEKAQTWLRVVKNPDGWERELRRGTVGSGENEKLVVLPTTENVSTILTKHPAWEGKLAYDEFLNSVVTTGAPPWHATDKPKDTEAGPWSDEDVTRLVAWLGREVNITVHDAIAYKAVLAHAQTNKKHPIRDWLDSLKWDGTHRIHAWMSETLGVDHTQYSSQVGKWFLIGAVARIYWPGCKLDTMLVLEGPQGKKKSSALASLFGSPYCRDTPIDFASKDRFIQLQGTWCYEIAELDGMDRTEVNRIKSFLTSANDAYRPPYGRANVKIPRRLVFAGTVNRDDYLRDETGNRRFLPVKCRGEIKLDVIAQHREQLFAEAVAAYQANCKWWPETDEDKALCAEEQAKRLQHDEWAERIQNYLTYKNCAWTTIADCLFYALNINDAAKWSRVDQMRVSKALTYLGWERHQIREGNGRHWRYYPKAVGG